MTGRGATGQAPATTPLVLLRLVGFISFFDRFSTAPMLVVMAHQIGISLAAAIQLTTIYAVLYGLGQPLWGLVSDRIGRLTVLKVALGGVVIGSIVSIVIPGYLPLLISRAFVGLMMGALYPTLLTIYGDTLKGHERYREISNLQTVAALGTTGATLVSGALALWIDWRAVFGITIFTAGAGLVGLLRVRGSSGHGSRGTIGAAFSGWALWVYFVAFLDGVVLLGMLTYFVPAMEHGGLSVALAGLLAATYGVGVIIGSQGLKLFSRRVARPVVLMIGGACLIAAYLIAALTGNAIALSVTALLVGLGNSFLHSSLQGWATAVSPTARATSVSLFATALFLGAGVATGVTAGVAAAGYYQAIFAGSAVLSVVLVVLSAISFTRWLRTHSLD